MFKVPAQMQEQLRPKAVSGFAISAGGSQLLVHVSNEEGSAPLLLSAANVGLAADGVNARPSTLKPITYAGQRNISIPACSPMLSDPIDMVLTAGTELMASVYVSGSILDRRQGASGDHTLSDASRAAAP